MEIWRWALGGWWLLATGLYLLTAILALIHFRVRPRRATASHPLPPISLLVPLRGLDPEFETNLRGFLGQTYPEFELLLSVAGATDPAIPVARRLMAEYPGVASRLITGEVRIARNPKIHNLVRSYAEARHDLVLMSDANVVLPPDALDRLVRLFDAGVGLVSAVPIGVRPTNFVGELECAMLNGHGARWQAAAAFAGVGVAVGKILFLRKSDLDRTGGIAGAARHPCEDRAMEGGLRSLGRRVAISRDPVIHPVGTRRFRDFWSRHVRYLWCRRAFNRWTFLAEPFIAGLAASIAGGLFWSVPTGLPAPLLMLANLALWLVVEAVHLALQGWPISWRSPIAWLVRELLLPVLWVRAATSRVLVWQDSRFDAALT